MTQKENRIYSMKEFRAVDNANEKVIEGHAAIFNQYTQIGDVFYEVIEYGAFDGCDLSDVALFVNHDTSRIPLARSRQDKNNNTMNLTIDNIGLAIRAVLDTEHNQQAADLYSAVARGDMSGMSFAFSVADEEWQDLKSEMPTRRIKRIKKVYEVSACNYPAYTTDLNARAKIILEQARKELRSMTFEEFAKHMKQYEAQKADEEENERTRLINEYEKHPERFKRISNQPPAYIPGKGFVPVGERTHNFDSELVNRQVQSGQDLKEKRAVESTFNVFGEKRMMKLEPNNGETAKLIVPQYTSSAITPTFPVVSSLVEAVAHLSLFGGESFSQPYISEIAEGGYTKEGEDAHEAETVFSYAQINRTKITAYAELTEELEKLPAAACRRCFSEYPHINLEIVNPRNSFRARSNR